MFKNKIREKRRKIEMSKLNFFVIKKSEEKGVFKINLILIICKINCLFYGSVIDFSSLKRFDGL